MGLRTASLSLIREVTACKWTIKVDSSKKMDSISGQRPEIASYMSRVRNIFSGGFLALGHDFQEPKEANRCLFQDLIEARLPDRRRS
jgi:hypothetical protein